ncbi:NAD-binding protein (NmrA family transcriptional regulator) [Colletotrichum tofieldiae]|uniref:NAD-binding protein (NmrA family transcriptional regulator) n=1 Tax=Colletotrichum tofieldiae TaxID=708197 RepID=A0A166XF02_9PEZI|nr:NAD-binding protein (NmrA family transcriptional regulator) [Colletotrichum tofieldiae]GKT95265.1 NAD-binding protein [Colletotrichum tofieldiae]
MTISSDSTAPLIAVVGSTGLQGGSVINNLAASDKPYRIRGLTRDAKKEKAQALAKRGVEIVTVDLSSENATGIQKAFQDATYVFIMTNYWEHLNKDREIAEGKTLVEAAQKVGMKLLLISSEPSATKVSDGKLTKVYHFDSKAEISDHARALGVPFVDIHAAGYMNNFTTFSRPRPAGDGSYVIDGTWPEDLIMPLIDTYHDYGLFVQLAIESDEFNKGDGKIIWACGDHVTVPDQVKIISRVTGKKIAYNKVTDEQSRAGMAQAGLPPFVVDDMIEMFKLHGIWDSAYADRSRIDTAKLARRPRTFQEYVENEDWSTVFV